MYLKIIFAGFLWWAALPQPLHADFIDKGNALFNEGNLGGALEMYNSALRAGENPTLSRYYKSNVLYKMGQTGRAILEYKAIISANPDFVKPYINLAGIYFEMDVVGEALNLYKSALKLDPENTLIIKMLAECYLKIENYAEAILHFEIGMEKEPANEEWLYGLIESYQQLKDLASIEVLLIDNINKFDNPSLWFLLGDIQDSNGKLKEAALSYKKGLQRDRGQEAYYFKLSNIQSELGQPFLAVNTLIKGLEAKTLKKDVYIDLANMYYNLGDKDKAFSYFYESYKEDVKGGYQGMLYLLEEAANENDKRFLEYSSALLSPEIKSKAEVAQILAKLES